MTEEKKTPLEMARAGGEVLRQQRKDEILAAYAAAPPGIGMTAFLRQVGTNNMTWAKWIRDDPDFATRYQDIRELRTRIAIEPFETHIRALCDAVVMRGIDGSDSAARMVLEALGVLKSGSSVKVNTTITDTNVSMRTTAEQMDDLIEERKQLRAVLERAAQSIIPELPPPEEVDGISDAQ